MDLVIGLVDYVMLSWGKIGRLSEVSGFLMGIFLENNNVA